ncbi:hypothetical protein ASF60_18075 [Methylobacterium sp. Leaf113]|uniref:hypothetical protein n=1 Tax=Methylobacterium sp. Leaf113 TaxID=1736259 RepID=UPI0006F1CADF|nr:hypothetical protein [Methylobacterium sp. Leaf113]KQP91352.1 hypothetical protein ASF60_18075 [Methylobacterium sp. Leaf113]
MRRDTSDFRTEFTVPDTGNTPDREYVVRVGWPEFYSKAILLPEGSDVATVARAAKEAARNYRWAKDRVKWPAFSWEEDRFLAPDEPAPQTFIVGPSQALIERQGGTVGYHAAQAAMRKPNPTAAEVAAALGRGSPDGSQGNIWTLFDARHRTLRQGAIHVLDEASERKLRDLLAGKAVPTGRIVEVTYSNPDGCVRTQRHVEFGQIDKVSYDPAPVVVGREIMDAMVLSAFERVDLSPGTNVKEEAYALTPKAEAAIKAFAESVPMTQEAVTAGSDALEREIERSFGEPLDAVPDPVEDLQAQAVRRVIKANTLLAQAVEVLGCEAVDLLMHHLAAPDLSEAA